MSNSPLLNRAEVLAIYGGLCGLLYVETDGFRREVPCVNMMPPIFLTLFTLTTRMNGSVKLCTSSAFLVFGEHQAYKLNKQMRENLATALTRVDVVGSPFLS
uniref:Uncharacterized protein n=1 Tax=Setaria digitata TaxID=48799 RepID=A0A915PJ53_9BILA